MPSSTLQTFGFTKVKKVSPPVVSASETVRHDRAASTGLDDQEPNDGPSSPAESFDIIGDIDIDIDTISAGIFSHMLALIWLFLDLTPTSLKNPVYARIITSIEALEMLMSDSLLTFAPGLVESLVASTPPPLSFFKSLPTDTKGHWAVYCLVLEKDDFRPAIYIGSGTSASRGVAKRFYQYDTKSVLPKYVELALNDGFVITHKGLLCWCPTPSVLTRFAYRCLFVLIEAVLSMALWAMRSRTDHGLPRISDWIIEDLEYDGLCSHSSIHEGIRGEDFGLTDEQKLRLQAERDERVKNAGKARYHAFKARDYEGWKAKRRSINALWAARHPDKKRAFEKEYFAKVKASGKYKCDVCDMPFVSQHHLGIHFTSRGHQDKVNGITRVIKQPKHKSWSDANRARGRYACRPCGFNGGTKQQLTVHLASGGHKTLMAAIEEATAQAA